MREHRSKAVWDHAICVTRGDAKPPAGTALCACILAEPRRPESRRLIEFWKDRQAHGGIVLGRDVPSRAIAPMLSHLIVYQPIDDGTDLQIRLAGTLFLRRFGRDVSGMRLSDLYAREHFAHVRYTVLGVLRAQEPCVHEVAATTHNGILQRFEVVHVPALAADGITQVDLTGYFFYD